VRLATATVGKEVVIDTDPPGVLVPVEPDYEAAIKKSREAMSWADEEVMESRMNDYDWWEVILRAGVTAALGIGDNELSKALECQHREVVYDRDICADCGAGIGDNDEK
jgi:hypothetical protein